MLFFEDRTPFATGAAGYDDGQPESDLDARIMLEVQINAQPVRAMVDTGAPFVVLDPELAGALDYQSWEFTEEARLWVRGIRYEGSLHRVEVALFAERGESHSLTATIFVPRLRLGDVWGSKPNFIGLSLLDRIRYAIDPATNTFYFGPLA
jgi:hypothetical protein